MFCRDHVGRGEEAESAAPAAAASAASRAGASGGGAPRALRNDDAMRIITSLLIVLLLVFLPSNAHAEYTRVVLTILGMDCAICAHGIRVAVQKVDGVESVELSLERAEADIRLRPDNRVSLDQFRKIVKANGFEPKHARVTAVGIVRDVSGQLTFDVSGAATALVISPDKSAPEAYKQLRSAAGSKGVASFEVVGTVEPKKGDGVETVAIASARAK